MSKERRRKDLHERTVRIMCHEVNVSDMNYSIFYYLRWLSNASHRATRKAFRQIDFTSIGVRGEFASLSAQSTWNVDFFVNAFIPFLPLALLGVTRSDDLLTRQRLCELSQELHILGKVFGDTLFERSFSAAKKDLVFIERKFRENVKM
jgi:hypothetical protein